MGLLEKLLKGAVQTATLPLDIVKDTVTLGGSAIDEESAIIKKLKKLRDTAEEAEDEIDNL